MALQHKPETGHHQDPSLRWLAHWYTQPQGCRVRERLLDRIRQQILHGPGERVIEWAPVPMLDAAEVPLGSIFRMDSTRPAIRAAAEAWPIESECARIIVLAHLHAYSHWPERVVAEAARVLEPEGMIFMLEGNRLQIGAQGRVRASSRPEGLRRRQCREVFEAAGLEVLEQRSLSLLPPGLPAVWQRRLAGVDTWTRRGLPPLGSVILTLAHKRVDCPLRPAARLRFSRPNPAMRPGLVSSRH